MELTASEVVVAAADEAITVAFRSLDGHLMFQVAAEEEERGRWSRNRKEPEVYVELNDQGRSGYDCASGIRLERGWLRLTLTLPGEDVLQVGVAFDIDDADFGRLSHALSVVLGENDAVELLDP